jgi:hypothetical protein
MICDNKRCTTSWALSVMPTAANHWRADRVTNLGGQLSFKSTAEKSGSVAWPLSWHRSTPGRARTGLSRDGVAEGPLQLAHWALAACTAMSSQLPDMPPLTTQKIIEMFVLKAVVMARF